MARSATILGLSLSDEGAGVIAGRARGTPRIGNRLLRRVRDVAQVRGIPHVDAAIAADALDFLQVDADGLDHADRTLLQTMAGKFGGGPVGLSTLAVALGEDPGTLEEVYEPYLIQQGLIQRTPRGRVLTPRGRRALGRPELPADPGRPESPPLFD